jgi:hypothetical protein
MPLSEKEKKNVILLLGLVMEKTATRFLLQRPAASIFPSVYTKAYISSAQELASSMARLPGW